MFAMTLNREKKIVLTTVLGPCFLPPKETPLLPVHELDCWMIILPMNREIFA